MKRILTTILGKILIALMKIRGSSGSALPGLWIERINKNFLKKSLAQLPQGVIVITGTNGKTTTTKMISESLSAANLRVFTNKTGSNLVRGVIAAILLESTWTGKLPFDIAIIEQDEAHGVLFTDQINPRGVVALNVMRDQLDRYGEIDRTSNLIAKIASRATDFVVLNANDKRIAKIADTNLPAKVVWFGHDESLISEFVDDDQFHTSDNLDFFQYSHPESLLHSISADFVRINLLGQDISMNLNLEGAHNALNATAAALTLHQLMPDVEKNKLATYLGNVRPAFGRGEIVRLDTGGKIHIQLVKNPSGFTHSLKLLDHQKFDIVGVLINDNFADGRDVSWLWDVSFETIKSQIGAKVVCGGSRGSDMAVRLKYDEVEAKTVKDDVSQALDHIISELGADQDCIMFCTYTAMTDLRKQLIKFSDHIEEALT